MGAGGALETGAGRRWRQPRDTSEMLVWLRNWTLKGMLGKTLGDTKKMLGGVVVVGERLLASKCHNLWGLAERMGTLIRTPPACSLGWAGRS